MVRGSSTLFRSVNTEENDAGGNDQEGEKGRVATTIGEHALVTIIVSRESYASAEAAAKGFDIG